ncbi:MAG TPA: hypothetical protein PKY56_02910 [Candidatus Kapabacteria bacterium]|nr:hypothetical protein [Candidatus Kapabacteria bacterium]HPO62415.1 hypothetical protein [Candidatus Kapabacteria bacterium]
MKKIFFYFIVLLIISCSNNNSNEITIGSDDKFQLSDGEKINENYSKDIFNLYDTIVNVNSEYQAPLHKVITAKDYNAFIAIPVGIENKKKLMELFLKDTISHLNSVDNQSHIFSIVSQKDSHFIYNSLILNNNYNKAYILSAINNDSVKISNLFKQNYAKNKIIFND